MHSAINMFVKSRHTGQAVNNVCSSRTPDTRRELLGHRIATLTSPAPQHRPQLLSPCHTSQHWVV